MELHRVRGARAGPPIDLTPATYRSLFATRGFTRLVSSMLLGRLASTMLQLIIVLFALQRYGSATVAGAVVFLGIAPGLVLSPIAGALLDRHGRGRLVVLDYLVAATALVLIASLALVDALPVAALFAIVILTSLTNPLSAAGMRTLFPVLVPSHLWPRANAIDGNGYLVASIFGPAVAGALYAAAGPEAALFLVATTYVGAAVAASGIHDPTERRDQGSVMTAARDGLRYVMRNQTLRTLALSVSTASAGSGMYFIALPVLLLQRVGVGPATIGQLYTLYGIGGMVAAIVIGRLDVTGREGRLLGLGYLIDGAVVIAVLLFPALAVVGGAMLVLGMVSGPVNVVMFTLRQRRTAPEWFGRAFAISMSLNYSGNPIGSAIAGAIIPLSLPAAFVVSSLLYVSAAIMSDRSIPTAD